MSHTHGREHVLIVDRVGYDRYRMPDGSPVVDPHAREVTVLTNPKAAQQVRRGECSEVFAFDIENPEYTSSVIETVHRHNPIDSVIVFPESLQLPVAEVRGRLGIPGPGTAQILPFRDKLPMKEKAVRGSLEVAEAIPVESAADVAGFLATHGQVFLKPRTGTGTAGVYPVKGRADLDALAADPSVSLAGYQAERYIDAPMIHIDAVVVDGEPIAAVTSQYLTSTLAHLTGKPLASVAVSDPDLLQRSGKLLSDVIGAFSAHNAVLHLEAFTGPELVFNEVACRPGGGGITAAVQALTGYNIFESMVRISLGESPTSSYEITADCAGFLLLYGRPEVFAEVDDGGIPTDWIIERKIAARPGERYEPVGRAGGSFVTYVVRGHSEEQVRDRIAIIERTVRVRFEGDPA